MDMLQTLPSSAPFDGREHRARRNHAARRAKNTRRHAGAVGRAAALRPVCPGPGEHRTCRVPRPSRTRRTRLTPKASRPCLRWTAVSMPLLAIPSASPRIPVYAHAGSRRMRHVQLTSRCVNSQPEVHACAASGYTRRSFASSVTSSARSRARSILTSAPRCHGKPTGRVPPLRIRLPPGESTLSVATVLVVFTVTSIFIE